MRLLRRGRRSRSLGRQQIWLRPRLSTSSLLRTTFVSQGNFKSNILLPCRFNTLNSGNPRNAACQHRRPSYIGTQFSRYQTDLWAIKTHLFWKLLQLIEAQINLLEIGPLTIVGWKAAPQFIAVQAQALEQRPQSEF